MTPEHLVLRDDLVEVVLDPGQGADVLTLRHRPSGLDVLFSTPWREHADAVRAGRPGTTADPVAAYLERYRGGWNTLCPNAGPPRVVHGAPLGFHGEAVLAEWEVVAADEREARLRLALFSVPVIVDRLVRVEDGGVLVEDVLTNTSDVGLEIDYVSHPAFGGAFLDGTVSIDTGARTYSADPGTPDGPTGAGSVTAWPGTDAGVDLRVVPTTQRHVAFGWLSGFDGTAWATVTNHDLGFGVRIAWDPTHLPYAWFWQELGHSEGFPWYRRARAVAIEPASTPTSGPDRRSALTLPGGGSVRLPVTLSLLDTKDS
ncbi:DUF4432 family protein [Marmoricola sp. RAF53]|uniref:DUF4432 family protein n=1 Tax=Marmoricola sp. RAF53 TaxID=3233059 RepID=UPI003F9E5F43